MSEGPSFLGLSDTPSCGLDHVLCIPSSLMNIVFAFVVTFAAANTV